MPRAYASSAECAGSSPGRADGPADVLRRLSVAGGASDRKEECGVRAGMPLDEPCSPWEHEGMSTLLPSVRRREALAGDHPPLERPTSSTVASDDRWLVNLRKHDDAWFAFGGCVGVCLLTFGIIALPIGIASSPVLAISGGLGILIGGALSRQAVYAISCYPTAPLIKRRIRRRLARAEHAFQSAIEALDAAAAEGWRPREGARMPAGRTDTHDRYRVEATATPAHITLTTVQWRYVKDEWRRCNHYSGRHQYRERSTEPDVVRVVVCDDDEALTAARDELEAICVQREGRAHIALSEESAVAAVDAERLQINQTLADIINGVPSA